MKKRKRSIWSAFRLMGMIFMFNPVSMLAMWSFGKVELLLTVLAPGFQGGMIAGSVSKAMTAAVVVGAAYSFVNLMLVLAMFHFVSRLPTVGEHIEAALNSIGGFGVSAALVVAVITLPLVLTLLISSYIGTHFTNLTIGEQAYSVEGSEIRATRRSPRDIGDHGKISGPSRCRFCEERFSASTHGESLTLDPLDAYLETTL